MSERVMIVVLDDMGEKAEKLRVVNSARHGVTYCHEKSGRKSRSIFTFLSI
jgi:hypothetical protein